MSKRLYKYEFGIEDFEKDEESGCRSLKFLWKKLKRALKEAL